MVRIRLFPKIALLTILLAECQAGFLEENTQPVRILEFESPLGAVPLLYPTTRKPNSLVVPLQNGHLVKCDPSGKIEWDAAIGDSLTHPVAVGHLGKDENPSILAVADGIEVVALTPEGKERWRFTLPGRIGSNLSGKTGAWRGPTCADLNGDGRDETLVSNNFGWIVCLSPEGNLLWRRHADNFRAGPAAVGDVDGDGLPEVVYGTENNRILCLEGDGSLRWLHHATGKFGRSNIALADLDGDGEPEAIWSTSFNTPEPLVYAAHAGEGTPFWSAPTILHGYGSVSVGDVDSDGTPNVVYGDRANTIYAFDPEGNEVWRRTTGGRGFMFPQNLADVDGDGTIDVLAVVRDSNEEGKSLFILNGRSGEIQFEKAIPGRNSISPLVADFDSDGNLETLVFRSNPGAIEVYRFGGKAGSAVPWPADRVDSSRTGYLPPNVEPSTKSSQRTKPDESAVPELEGVRIDSVLLGTHSIQIDWPEDLPERCFIDLTVIDPEGVRVYRIDSIDPEHPPDSLPVHFYRPGNHEVRIDLWDEESVPSKKLAASSMEVRVGTFGELASSLEADLDRLEKEISTLDAGKRDAGRMLRREIASVRGDLASYGALGAIFDSGDLVEADVRLTDLNRLRSSVERIESLRNLARLSDKTSVAFWEDPNPWDLIPPLETVPSGLPSSPVADVWLLGHETEYRAFYLCNLLPRPLDIQLRLPLQSPLRLREVIQIPRDDGAWIPDALPLINQSRTLHLSPGEVRQVWVDLSSRGLPAGDHETSMEILPLGRDGDRFTVKFRLHVQPVSLADAPEFAICNWTNPESLRSVCDQDDFVEELLHQGMNVVTLGAPGRKCDEQGNLVGEPDWTRLDRQLEALDPGYHILLLHGPHIAAPPGTEPGSEVWVRGLRNGMRELAAHLAAKGWGLDRWAFYPVDEPGLFGGTAIQKLREIVKPAKQAAPEIQFYTDPAGGVTRENFADLVRAIDIWQPELAMLRRNPDLIDFFLETGGWVWSYEAPGEAKRLLPLGYYRAQPLVAQWMGLRGAGHWHFGYFQDGNDFWLTSDDTEYGDHYMDGSRIVQSRRWLAFMDGVEDARLFLLLREKANEVRNRSGQSATVEQAEKLLGPDLRHLLRKQWEQDDIARYLIDYELSLEGIDRIRREAVTLILKLDEEGVAP